MLDAYLGLFCGRRFSSTEIILETYIIVGASVAGLQAIKSVTEQTKL